MNSPVIMLEEQLGDIHSSQIAYKLTVRNASAEPLLIMALQPHVPKGAQLMDGRTASRRRETLPGQH